MNIYSRLLVRQWYTTLLVVIPVVAQLSDEEVVLRRMYLPPKYNYSLDMLNKSDPVAGERVQRLLDSLQREIFGPDSGQSFYDDIIKLLSGGMIHPDVLIDNINGDAEIRFLMWSYLDNKYKKIEDMEDAEFDIMNGMLEYFARIN